MKKLSFLLISLFLFISCNSSEETEKKAEEFINTYNKEYLRLYYNSSLAEWELNTKIIEGDSSNLLTYRNASETLAAFTGSKENINKIREFLEDKDNLSPIITKQLEIMLFKAANYPQIIPAIVKERIATEAAQTQKLYGFDFRINGRSVSTNDIDNILTESNDLRERLAAWNSSKEVGKVLKDGIIDLRRLRNETVQALGYNDYFSYQVSDYGMNVREMMDLNLELIQQVWPLYRELHTYARYELAKKYGAGEVPDYLPAHWVPNRWGQDWSSMVQVKGFDLDGLLKPKGAEWIMKQGESFYLSLGFDSLPPVFWEKSSLYPVPPDAKYKKNNHASAWNMDLEDDLRSLMSVIPNASWYETVHHELGHVYYYQCYNVPGVPPLLREGANRAFHEAIGSQMGLAAMQRPFLEHIKLLKESQGSKAEPEINLNKLLNEALNYIVFIPWASGTMTEFEHDLYVKNLSPGEYNKRWWELVKKYQGIVPPSERGNEYMDAATKTHINDDAAQYYDYALSYVLLFQFHDYVSRNILKQDPRSTNYFGNRETGEFLKDIMSIGATADWRNLVKDKTGEEMNAGAMLRYFEPLLAELKKINEGRKYTLPERI